ncbi:uncharacterized protein LOC119609453 [Lucilia sericata]|uniref:uncharacterized protein LOC119609453 n=1 Tax=Lucilia sericata TaxID=13632 RepID=UPI0018A83518|nr:uncharacterized protein LOC119609453 [Lucilia sericata]
MFASHLLGRLTKFYTYPCSKVTFLLPFNCKSSMCNYSTKKAPITSRKSPVGTKTVPPKPHQSYTSNPSKKSNGFKAKRKPPVPRNFATEFATPNTKLNASIGSTTKTMPQTISTLEGLREFFSHPLTWDRNNGYLNLLLGLAIFGYSFCTTSSGESGTSYGDKGK